MVGVVVLSVGQTTADSVGLVVGPKDGEELSPVMVVGLDVGIVVFSEGDDVEFSVTVVGGTVLGAKVTGFSVRIIVFPDGDDVELSVVATDGKVLGFAVGGDETGACVVSTEAVGLNVA